MLKKDIDMRKRLGRLKDRLEDMIYSEIAGLSIEAWTTKEPLPYQNRTDGRYMQLKKGDCWGELFDCAWFRFTGRVPVSAAGRHVVLMIDISGEGCVFDSEGNPARGITSITSRNDWPLGMWGKRVLQVSGCAEGGESVDIWMDAGCNDLEGQYAGEGIIRRAGICVCDDEMRGLYYDLAVVISLYDGFVEDGNTACAADTLRVLKAVYDKLSIITPQTIKEARLLLSDILKEKNKTADFFITSTGHAHIDLLFLWPKRETIRKGARTYSTVLDLMEQYKGYDYRFCCSQPQMYKWMSQSYPPLFERIRRREKEGKWECVGAMWVEADTNIPSGESLVRQLLYGKRYFKKEFGKDMEVCFLPDVFGYSGALPQLLVKSRTPYFLTQKLSQNDTNRFPRHTFIWRGIDGSQVLAHMLPEDSYSSAAVPQIAMKARRNFLDKDVSNEAMQLFGVGDGGGGPGPEHIERLIRQQNLKGAPPVKPGSITEFFHRIDKNRAAYRRWSGELYFERHQGTYTSIARIKKHNRQMETALRECEFACVLAERFANKPYPHKELREIWEEVLLYQFHDCLPGSSINRVYDEAYTRYEYLKSRTNDLTKAAYEAVAELVDVSGIKPLVLFNSLSFERKEWVKVHDKFIYVTLPPLGWTAVDMAKAGMPATDTAAYDNALENGCVRVTFGDDGSISSIFDKRSRREVLRPGGLGNALAVYDDRGDCWDIDKGYLRIAPQKPRLLGCKPYSEGPYRGFVFSYLYGGSHIEQTAFLSPDSPNVQFRTCVDWQEEYKMLRTSFDVDILSQNAKCEIQFGYTLRPTHTNTSWDEAKFEVCAHRWVDIGDGGYGAALLNDCKYGYRVAEGRLDLNLLRSQMCPSAGADMGRHEFVYTLYPHSGDIVEGGVIKEGLKLNTPVWTALAKRRGALPGEYAMLKLSSPNIFVEAIKKAEDSEGCIIRMYEGGGERTKTQLALDGFAPKGIVNLLEEPYDGPGMENGSMDFGPFEVHSLLVNRL